MAILLILSALLIFYGLGSIIRNLCQFDSKNENNELWLTTLSLNIILGLSTYLLISHLIAFISSSYRLAVWLSFALIFLFMIIFKSKISSKIILNDENDNKIFVSILLYALPLFCAISMAYRDAILGSPDRIHMAYASIIAQNDIYPPLAPIGKELALDYYHYGTDLISVTFKVISKLGMWDILSFQIGLGVFLTFATLFTLIRYFIKSTLVSLLMVLIVFFYTSINSVDFFIRELDNLSAYPNIYDYLIAWILNSWTSVSHMASQLRLLGQNLGFPLAFTLFYLLMNLPKVKTHLSNYIPIILVSFSLYFVYPTFWYPLLGGVLAYIAFNNFIIEKSKVIKASFVEEFVKVAASLYLGKFLSFTAKHTEVNGINVLKFSPSLEWVHWGKSYINYFYDLNYLRQIKPILDPVIGNYHLVIPLFSSISFREFGFSFLVATLIFIVSMFKGSIVQDSKTLILLFSAYASFTIPFSFKFILRPVETSRFLLFTKILCLMFIVIYLGKFLIKNSRNSTLIRVSLILLCLILLAPGFSSILPDPKLSILENRAISASDKIYLTKLESIRSSGDVALDSTPFEFGGDFASVAGFYGVGGQFYKDDTATRSTAIYLMNPILLQELKVNYVITSVDSKISKLGLERLANQEWFQEVDVPLTAKNFKVYKFLALNQKFNEADSHKFKQEYLWVLGLPTPANHMPFKDGNNQLITAATKEEAIQIRENLRSQLKTIDPTLAAWVKEQALYRSDEQ